MRQRKRALALAVVVFTVGVWVSSFTTPVYSAPIVSAPSRREAPLSLQSVTLAQANNTGVVTGVAGAAAGAVTCLLGTPSVLAGALAGGVGGYFGGFVGNILEQTCIKYSPVHAAVPVRALD